MDDIAEQEIQEQAALFAVLGDPTRLRLLRLLQRQRDPDALCVNALTAVLEVTQPAVSQHLRVLKKIGLVSGQRRGNRVHYFVTPEALERCRTLASAALTVGDGQRGACEKVPCPMRRQRHRGKVVE